MHTQDRIILDPNICHGKPVIRGTRVPITIVVGSLAGGMTFEEVQHEYDLSAEDIRAALMFVGELAGQESFHPLPATQPRPGPLPCDGFDRAHDQGWNPDLIELQLAHAERNRVRAMGVEAC
jgi:uncharacterized protein (DUF433 family)